jgi:purine nucleoside phosphorylase
MERAGDGPAASEVYVSGEAVVLPLQKCVHDHRQEQMPYISYVTAMLLMDVNNIIAINGYNFL